MFCDEETSFHSLTHARGGGGTHDRNRENGCKVKIAKCLNLVSECKQYADELFSSFAWGPTNFTHPLSFVPVRRKLSHVNAVNEVTHWQSRPCPKRVDFLTAKRRNNCFAQEVRKSSEFFAPLLLPPP